MVNNYRCGQKIIDLANEVISQCTEIINTNTVCKTDNMGEVYVGSRYQVDKYLDSIIKYKDWFILVRTNKDLYKMEEKLNEHEIPFVSFRKGEISLDEMRKCMNEDKVKLLTIHTAKGLESPNVMLWGNFPIIQKPYLRNEEEIRVEYVGLTRAINKLLVLN